MKYYTHKHTYYDEIHVVYIITKDGVYHKMRGFECWIPIVTDNRNLVPITEEQAFEILL